MDWYYAECWDREISVVTHLAGASLRLRNARLTKYFCKYNFISPLSQSTSRVLSLGIIWHTISTGHTKVVARTKFSSTRRTGKWVASRGLYSQPGRLWLLTHRCLRRRICLWYAALEKMQEKRLPSMLSPMVPAVLEEM